MEPNLGCSGDGHGVRAYNVTWDSECGWAVLPMGGVGIGLQASWSAEWLARYGAVVGVWQGRGVWCGVRLLTDCWWGNQRLPVSGPIVWWSWGWVCVMLGDLPGSDWGWSDAGRGLGVPVLRCDL